MRKNKNKKPGFADVHRMDFSNLVYIGTYTQFVGPTGEKAEGIYIYSLDPAVGSLSLEQVVKRRFQSIFPGISPERTFSIFGERGRADQRTAWGRGERICG